MPFRIVRNDIVKMQVDAIVNTANPLPTYAAGTDTAVYEAAGEEELLKQRIEIGEIEPGSSAITDGFALPAKYIIHTVGTSWHGGDEGEEDVIRSCYKSVFRVAKEHEVESLAIPLLASGSYHFPKGIALRIALSEIELFLADHDMDVYLVVFDEKSFALSSELYGDIDEYINDNYVEEKNIEEYGYVTEEICEKPAMAAQSFAGAAPLAPAKKPLGALFNKSKIRTGAAKEASILMPGAAEEAVMSASCAAYERSLEDVIGNLDKTFMELVFSFADAKGFSDVEVQKKANLDRKAFSKLKCGTTKNPSKSTALAFAIALELNLDETKDLLSRAGFALSPCSKQDIIVRYFIEHEAYDIHEINIALFDHGAGTLGAGA